MLIEEEEEEEEEVSALLSSSIALNTDQSELSPDDIAWVDSCIVSDPQVSEDSWGSMREALLETLTAQFDTDAERPSESDALLLYRQEGDDSVTVPVGEKGEAAGIIRKCDERDSQTDSEDNAVESYDEIFKVWELEKYNEEEDDESELIKQLKKVLMGKRTSTRSVEEEVVDVDELVAGMMDLSLKPPKV